MDEAIVKISNQKPYPIKVTDIKNHNNFDVIIDNIYCSTVGCNCKLQYVNGIKPHLRTFRLRDHIPECIYSKERIEEEKRKRREGIVKGSISEESLRRRQNYGFKKYFSIPKVSDDQTVNRKKREKKKKIIKPDSDIIKTEITIASFDITESTNQVDKVAPIPSVHINEVDEKYLNKSINLFGLLEDIDIDKNPITLTLKSSKKNKIILPEAYFSSTQLHNPKVFLETIYKYIKDTNREIPVCVSSILTHKNNIYNISVPLFSYLKFLDPENINYRPKDASQLAATLSRRTSKT